MISPVRLVLNTAWIAERNKDQQRKGGGRRVGAREWRGGMIELGTDLLAVLYTVDVPFSVDGLLRFPRH